MVIRASRYILIPIEGRIVIVVSPCPVVSSPFPSGSVTGWYRNKKKSAIMVLTRVREATSFYCRTSGIVLSMCEKEFFLSSQRFFHIPKGGRESRPASVFFFLSIWHKTTIHDYSCRSYLLLMFSLIFFLPRLSRCDGDGEPSYPHRPDRSAREDEHPARQLHHQVGHRDFRYPLQFTAADML